MALHPIRLPKSAIHLFKVVVLQKKLLKALCDPTLNPQAIDATWIQSVWPTLNAHWVQRFCRGRNDSILVPLKVIAAAPLVARQALYDEFRRQHQVTKLFQNGGDFRDIGTLNGFRSTLTEAVRAFFKRCYVLFSHDNSSGWNGYHFPRNITISNKSYKDDFTSELPTSVICPYCDGDIGTPKFDHYLCKDHFPLVACSPWNLVPVCNSCNEVGAKGDRMAITVGPPRTMVGWLHPFFRVASAQVQIRLNGVPAASLPKLYSPDATEQSRLDNHTELVRTLTDRWTKKVAAFLDNLVVTVNRKRDPTNTVDSLVQEKFNDVCAARGKMPSAFVHAAVCQAVLHRRPEYYEEFFASNPPVLL